MKISAIKIDGNTNKAIKIKCRTIMRDKVGMKSTVYYWQCCVDAWHICSCRSSGLYTYNHLEQYDFPLIAPKSDTKKCQDQLAFRPSDYSFT